MSNKKSPVLGGWAKIFLYSDPGSVYLHLCTTHVIDMCVTCQLRQNLFVYDVKQLMLETMIRISVWQTCKLQVADLGGME